MLYNKSFGVASFKEDGCVSVRDTARDVIFVDYLIVKMKFSQS